VGVGGGGGGVVWKYNDPPLAKGLKYLDPLPGSFRFVSDI